VADLLVLSALRIEALTVGGRVQVIGMGPQRAATAKLKVGDRPVAVAMIGVAGGVAPGLAAGDLVVATELRTVDGRTRPLLSAGLVAVELERAGLPVHLGPILSVPRFARGSERAALGADGVLAADMESAWLADTLGDLPLVVVRSVADSLDGGPLRGGIKALAALRKVRPALEAWAGAVAPRRVELAAPRSFCAGVERAIEIVERALERAAPRSTCASRSCTTRTSSPTLRRAVRSSWTSSTRCPTARRWSWPRTGSRPAVRSGGPAGSSR
jgi:4-hydroxy-3-methylbut-2-enyl diphosphate reductase